MKSGKNLVKIAAVLLICGFLGLWWLAASTQADSKTYKVRPEVRLDLSSSLSETVHVMAAYERLMDRYMAMVEGNLKELSGNMKSGSRKLGSIEKKIDDLAARITKIEEALNIR